MSSGTSVIEMILLLYENEQKTLSLHIKALDGNALALSTQIGEQ